MTGQEKGDFLIQVTA